MLDSHRFLIKFLINVTGMLPPRVLRRPSSRGEQKRLQKLNRNVSPHYSIEEFLVQVRALGHITALLGVEVDQNKSCLP